LQLQKAGAKLANMLDATLGK